MRRRPAVLALLFLVAMVVVAFAPMVFRGEHIVPYTFQWGSITGIPNSGDPAVVKLGLPRSDDSPIFIHYPNACFAGECVRRGELPLWDPYTGCGAPALGGGQTYPFSPFQWPFFLVPTPWVYTLGLFLGCLWGALGAYLWLGGFELSPWQRALGATIWSFNPRCLEWMVYSDIWAAWWFGWLLWAWDRALDRDSRAWWLPALMVTGMVYCGHPETAFLLTGASVVYLAFAWRLGRAQERLPGRVLAGRFAAVAALAGLLTNIHWLSLLANLPDSHTYKGAFFETIANQRFPASTFLSPASDLYVSPMLFGLLFAGVWALRSHRKLWAAVALLLLGLLLGHLLFPFRPVLFLVSLGGLVRAVYARPLIWFALAPLAAFGAKALRETGGRTSRRRAALLCAGGALPILLFLAVQALLGNPLYRLLTLPWVAFCCAALGLLTAAAAVPPGRGKATLLAGGLLALCLDPYGRQGYAYLYFNRIDPQKAPAVQSVKPDLEAGHGRMAATLSEKYWVQPFLAPNMAEVWGVRDIRVVDVLLNRRMVALHDGFYGKDRSFFGTILNYPGVPPDVLRALGVQRLGEPVDENSGAFRWTAVPGALPRAFLAHEVVRSPGEAQSARLWREYVNHGPAIGSVILEGWSGRLAVGAPGPGDGVEWLEDGMARVRLRATTASGGVLVLLDTYASGWKAEVDGRPARIYPANLAFRAVEVPPGTHEVRFDYRPWSVQAGMLCLIAGWLAVLALAALAFTRRG
jgi:hypothetical protein